MPSHSLPQRQSLVAQTVAFLHAQIDAAVWRDWLPSERSLCELLQVSRNTLRAALAQMRQEGRIKPVHGAGNQIVGARPSTAGPRAQDVALLMPEPIERLRPIQSLWIDDMRSLLSERGVRLRAILTRAGSEFITPLSVASLTGEKVYTGQIVGEHNRDNDLTVNITRLKHLTNVRAASKEATIVLKAPRKLTLEYSLEYIEDDEFVEVTPSSIRLRKKILDENGRKRSGRSSRDRQEANA